VFTQWSAQCHRQRRTFSEGYVHPRRRVSRIRRQRPSDLRLIGLSRGGSSDDSLDRLRELAVHDRLCVGLDTRVIPCTRRSIPLLRVNRLSRDSGHSLCFRTVRDLRCGFDGPIILPFGPALIDAADRSPGVVAASTGGACSEGIGRIARVEESRDAGGMRGGRCLRRCVALQTS